MYAYAPEAGDGAAWFEAVGRGRTFVTNGPMLELEVGGAMPGDELRVEKGPKSPMSPKAKVNEPHGGRPGDWRSRDPNCWTGWPRPGRSTGNCASAGSGKDPNGRGIDEGWAGGLRFGSCLPSTGCCL